MPDSQKPNNIFTGLYQVTSDLVPDFFSFQLNLLNEGARFSAKRSTPKQCETVDYALSSPTLKSTHSEVYRDLVAVDSGIYEGDEIRVEIEHHTVLTKLQLYGETLLSRSLIYEEKYLRTVYADDRFTDIHKLLIRAAFLKYQERCGHEKARSKERTQCARDSTTIPPLPINRLTNEEEDPALKIEDEKILQKGFSSDTVVGYFHRLMVGPGTQSAGGRYTGWRGMVLDRFDEDSNRYGNAPVAIMQRNNGSGRPWQQAGMMRLNAVNLDRDPNVNTWAGVIAHEFMHNLFDIPFEPDHQPGDYAYVFGDCVAGSAPTTLAICAVHPKLVYALDANGGSGTPYLRAVEGGHNHNLHWKLDPYEDYVLLIPRVNPNVALYVDSDSDTPYLRGYLKIRRVENWSRQSA